MTFTTPGTDALPTGSYSKVYVLKTNIRKPAQAISIQFNVGSYGIFSGQEALTNNVNTASAIHWALVRSVQALGLNQSGALVQLTDDETATGFYLYDPTNYAKLVDTNFGFPSVKITDDIGEVPDNAALTVGRHELRSLLERGVIKEYVFEAELETFPLPFQTVDMCDGFTGVLLDLSLSMTDGKEVITMILMDLG